MPAATLPLKSSGFARGDAWVLNENGYAGAFLEVTQAGRVTITVHANGHADRGKLPRMNLSVAGIATGFEVGAEPLHRAIPVVRGHLAQVRRGGVVHQDRASVGP